MTSEEIKNEIAQIAQTTYLLYKEARKFQNWNTMYLIAETLCAISDMLDACEEVLSED